MKYKQIDGLSEWSKIVDIETKQEPPSMLDLHEAVNKEDIVKVKAILEKDVDHLLNLEAPDSFGASALMSAVQRNCNEIAALLIQHGADINYRDASGRDSLMTACFVGNVEAATLLKKSDASTKTKDNFGNTILHCSIEGNHVNSVMWALNNGANLNDRDGYGWTPLIKNAAVGGLTEITRILLAEGADVDAQDIFGNTALIISIVRDHSHIAAELLDNGCNWELKTDCNRNALQIAQGLDRKVVLKLLVSAIESKGTGTIPTEPVHKLQEPTVSKNLKGKLEETMLEDENAPLYRIPDAPIIIGMKEQQEVKMEAAGSSETSEQPSKVYPKLTLNKSVSRKKKR